MLTFAWPWLFILIPLPWLIRKRTKPDASNSTAVYVPFYDQARSALAGYGGQRTARNGQPRWLKLLATLAWLLLVVASTRPQWLGDPIPVKSEARDLMLAVDISPSMQETDLLLKGYQATRLEVVKSVVTDFITQRQGDRVGLILFGAQPYIQVPLTFDLTTVAQLLDEATLGIAGNATAIGDSIGLGIKRLRERPADSRVLILLTDGANTGGEVSPEQAATLAAEAGVKIYTIGVGADEVLRRGIFGYRKENPSSDLDERLLQSIADKTDGQYFRARNTGELELIYESINQLEPIEQDQRVYRPTTEYYALPLAFSMVFLLMFWAINWILSHPRISKHFGSTEAGLTAQSAKGGK
ncbi:vWA domain-containing protein [Hahella ganghwensis]|uniref:vWA domain-containing protein n=1 Tax=Hahella ganghwensis TaxID=286420 RepID=UPI00035F7240|nr:VWA domain-containing protein [Hahella ganghwensis]